MDISVHQPLDKSCVPFVFLVSLAQFILREVQFVHRLYNLLGLFRVQDEIQLALVVVEVTHERAPAKWNFCDIIMLMSVSVTMAVTS